MEIGQVERKLKNLRVKVVDKPVYEGALQIGESDLEQTLQEVVGYRSEGEKARIHDVDCLSAIYRLRRGKDCDEIERCVALFLTTNEALTRASRRFFNNIKAGSIPSVPVSMTDHEIDLPPKNWASYDESLPVVGTTEKEGSVWLAGDTARSRSSAS